MKKNVLGKIAIVLLILVGVYFVVINAVSYIMYKEFAGYLPNIKTKNEEKKEDKKTVKKETTEDKGDTIDNYDYKVDLTGIEINKKLDFNINKDYKLSFLAIEASDIYGEGYKSFDIEFYINDKKVEDFKENIIITTKGEEKDNNTIVFKGFGGKLLYELSGRTDIKQLNLVAFSKDASITRFENKDLDSDSDMYPVQFEIIDKKLVITGQRTYHGPSIIYNGRFYGICRPEEENVGLASDLPKDLPVKKEYYYDSSLKKVDTKIIKTVSQAIEESNKYCNF